MGQVFPEPRIIVRPFAFCPQPGAGRVEVLPLSASRLTPYVVSPNPFTTFTTLPGHSSDLFSLYDVSGRRVGAYRGDRIGEGLAAGVYFLRAERGEGKPLRVVKVR